MNDMTRAREIVASAWCQKTTAHTVMDPALAEEFAQILVTYIANLDVASREITRLKARVAELEGMYKYRKLRISTLGGEHHHKMMEYRTALENKLAELADMDPVSDQQPVYDAWAKWIYQTLSPPKR